MYRRAHRKISSILEKLEIRALLSTIYVDIQAPGATKDGTSWEYAYTDLQTALTASTSGDTIKVADGTYKPTTDTDRNKSFNLKSGVGVFGGYAGYGASNPESRDVTLYPTVLSGELGRTENDADNSYHVVTATSVDSSAVLDGLTITSGSASGTDSNQKIGGGILILSNSSPTLNNCIITKNYAYSGSGIYSSSSSPILSNCSFTGNCNTYTYSSDSFGGGMYNDSSSTTFVNCTFSSNRSGIGGGMYNLKSNISLTNCSFTGNAAQRYSGGGMYNDSSSLTLTVCVFSNNSSSSSGGGSYNISSTLSLDHCVFSKNSASSGAGLYNFKESSISLADCSFLENTVSDGGGGICNYFSSPTLTNCTFIGNGGSLCSGTAISNSNASPILNNCLFVGNARTAFTNYVSSPRLNNCAFIGNDFGAMYNENSTPTLSSCTLVSNMSINDGAALTNASSSPNIINCIIWNNGKTPILNTSSRSSPVVSNSDIEGGYAGVRNINANPCFVQSPWTGSDGVWGTADDVYDVGLRSSSPCLDIGNNSANYTSTDLAGKERIQNSIIDLGAYEGSVDIQTKTFHVDVNAAGNNSGLSWENAFNSLQSALMAAKDGDVIKMADGIYKPTASTDRSISFSLKYGVPIYGGYGGYGETDPDARNNALYKTILSGEIGNPEDINDNSCHVVTATCVNFSNILEGLSIRLGSAAGSGINQNDGGGILSFYSTLTIRDCIIASNIAYNSGAGIYNLHSTSAIINSSFYDNRAGAHNTDLTAYGGGAIHNNRSSPSIINCVFIRNSSNGGALYNYLAFPTIANCYFTNNYGSGSVLYSNKSSPTMTNCILWKNGEIPIYTTSWDEVSHPSVTYCDIDVNTSEPSNINAEPLFVRTPWPGPDGAWGTADDDNGDLRLKPGSPCLNAGLNSANAYPIDFGGNSRIQNGVIDIGLYEGECAHAQNILHVDINAHGENNGSSWANAFTSLQSAISASSDGDEIHVADGTYKPTDSTDRGVRFVLRNGVSIYGGYAGSGAVNPDERNASAYPTILSGDIGVAGDNSDNSYCVIAASNLGLSVVLDGFVITDGTSPGNGAGMDVSNCSDLTVSHCSFIRNSITNIGGAMYVYSSSLKATDCIFAGNIASQGGGVNLNTGSSTFINCVFVGNKATKGGAIYNSSSHTALINCVLTGNSASTAGGIYSNVIWVTLTNSIVWNNGPNSIKCDAGILAIDHSDIEGGSAGVGNINASPVFVRSPWTGADGVFGTADDDYGDLRLKSGSACLDAGINTVNTENQDLAGNDRIQNGVIDIGAYEGGVPIVPKTLYVDVNATGTGDGASWANAFVTLQSAIGTATSGDTIKIADGTYKPTTTTDRTISFVLRDGVSILGGYAGFGAANPDARDTGLYPTILSGDIGKAGSTTDNSYHVVTANVVGSSTVLDGVTISYGNAEGTGTYQNYGGGMFISASTAVVSNCTFKSNLAHVSGGGIYNLSSSPTITNCVFVFNFAVSGGGIQNEYSSPVISRCTLYGNKANSSGGAIYNNSSAPVITNSLIAVNSANLGGGIFNYNASNPSIINCTFHANTATQGGAFYNDSGTPVLTNCIIWKNSSTQVYGYVGNITISYSDVEGGYTSLGNVNVDPLFVSLPWQGPDATWGTIDDTIGDYRLRSNSPLINGGNTAVIKESLDLGGNARIQDSVVDIGAYEGGVVPVQKTLYVDGNAVGAGDGTSWANAFTTLQPAIAAARDGDLIKVADGTYKPTTTTARAVSITLRNNVTIQGGYAGYGAANPDARDIKAYPTILSGDIGTIGFNADNSYHIMSAVNLSGTVVLEGLTFTQGYANAAGNNQESGGAFLMTSAGTVSFNSCFFFNNYAFNGGAVINISSTAKFNSCAFLSNIGTNGGVINNTTASSQFNNCTLVQNIATNGMISYNTSSSITVNNSISLFNGTVPFYNSSTASTVSVSYSDIQGGYTGTGNVNVDPGFVRMPWAGPDGVWNTSDDEYGDLRLMAGSALINAGSNIYATTTIDLYGNARVVDAAVDIGAFEGGITSTKTLFVDLNAAGTNDGSSWTNAFTSLHSALAIANAGDVIKVADGTYKPTTTTDRTISFSLRNGASIFGGYAGSGAANPDARDVVNTPTILSGDIGTAGDQTDNSYHVVTAIGLLTSTVLDGFTITLGCASGSRSDQKYGSAIYIQNYSILKINACSVYGNYSFYSTLYSYISSTDISNCRFVGNTATNNGMLNFSSSTFTLLSSDIVSNVATSAIYGSFTATPTLNNTIIWNSGTVPTNLSGTINDIQGSSKYGSINAYPNFVRAPWIGNDGVWGSTDDDYGDLSLRAGSPAINAGLNSAATMPTDLAGNARIQDNNVDLGVFEGGKEGLVSKVIYVDINAPGNGDGTSWANAFTSLSAAFQSAGDLDQIRIADGTYKPGATYLSTFAIRNGMSILGGYTGFGAADPDARDFAANKTILSGNIGNLGLATDNCYHVVTISGVISASIDGVTITGGYANGGDTAQKSGGGIYAENNGTIEISNCIIIGNTAESSGGGIYKLSGGMTLMNCALELNSAETSSALYFSTNSTVKNSTIVGNMFSTGGALDGIGTLYNCVVWNYHKGTFTAYNSVVMSSISGSGNVNEDPMFVRSPWIGQDGIVGTSDDVAGDLRLRPTSPALNIGNNTYATVSTDLNGNPRIQDSKVDAGAYEGAVAVTYKTWYVDGQSTGANDGTSWTNAFTQLQSAIAASTDFDVILIADGVYTPTTTNDRNLSFVLRNNVSILGGYAGFGAAYPNVRDYAAYPTILSGNIGSTTTADDDSYHVVTLYNYSAQIDGVTIAFGNANGSGNNAYGGGVFVSRGNLILKNSKVIQNSSSNSGGGIYAAISTLNITNSVIASNLALIKGGGIYSSASTLTAANIDLAFNLSQTGGGALITSSTLNISNSIVWGNSAVSSDQISNSSSTLNATYCNIKGGATGTGNISTNPMFVRSAWAGEDGVIGTLDDDAGDLRLRTGSPAVNAGNNSMARGSWDLACSDRIQNTTVDIGAYEGTVDVNAKTIYVDVNATGANDGTSWANAFTSLQAALRASSDGDQIRMADGTYKPTAGTLRTCSFVLRNDVSIYGGYAGYGAANPDARNILVYATILSGNIGNPDLNTDNSYHVVECFGLDSGRIDGVSIVRGYANGSTFIQYSGGGVFSLSSNFVVSNTQLLANTATIGGGLYTGSIMTLAGSILIGNVALAGNGGGVYANSSSYIVNCNFWDNSSSGSVPDVNATGGTIYNSICWMSGSSQTRFSGGISVLNSDIMTSPSSGNIRLDPLYVRNPSKGLDGLWGTPDDDYGDLRLKANSPCIDTGSNQGTGLGVVPTDMAGNPRIFDYPLNAINTATVDMGAYETVKTVYAIPGGPYVVDLGQSIVLAGSSENAIPGDVSYQWDFDGDGEYDDATGPTPTFSTDGLSGQTRVIALKVTNSALDTDIAYARISIYSNDLYVDTNAAGFNTGADWNNAYTQLTTALAAAKPGQVIHIADGVYYPTLSMDRNQSFVTTVACTLMGGYAGVGAPNPDARDAGLYPTVISGNIGTADATDNSYRLFTISATTTLDGLTLRDANSSNGGNVVYTTALLTVNNCTFLGNNAVTGSAVIRANANLSIANSLFTGDSVNKPSSVVSASNASVAISGCVFSGILGGTAISLNMTTLTISDCQFTGNSGACVSLNTSSGAVSNCRFSSNTYTPLYTRNCLANLVIANCQFTNNSVNKNEFYIGGAAIYNYASSPSIQHCTFTGNSVNSNSSNSGGGAIYNYSSSSPLISDCQFVNNQYISESPSYSGGAAIYNYQSSSPIITNCLFNGNSTSMRSGYNSGGGAICSVSSSPVISNSVFVGNQCSFISPPSHGGGGAVLFVNSPVSITGCQFTSNVLSSKQY